MKSGFRLALGAAAAAATLFTATGCGADATPASSEATVTIEHAQGSTPVPVNPKKVFTFDLAALDDMEAIGVEAQGVPEAEFPSSLSKYSDAKYTKIGGMKEPDLEKVAAEKPDLIIISGRTADSYEDLSKIAPTVDLSSDATKPLESFEANARSIGKIFEKSDEVEKQLTSIESTIAETKTTAEASGKKALITMVSGGKLTAYGAGSRFGLIHDVLGVTPVAEVKVDGAHGESISFEYIKEKNPDILYVIDRDTAVGTEGGEAATSVLDNELVNSTNAAKNNKIVSLDSSTWYLVGYGLRSVPSMIDEVAKGL
jgi:iron complex transport system substrate-binding protein